MPGPGGLGSILDTDIDVRTLISEINGGLDDTVVTKIMELYPMTLCRDVPSAPGGNDSMMRGDINTSVAQL